MSINWVWIGMIGVIIGFWYSVFKYGFFTTIIRRATGKISGDYKIIPNLKFDIRFHLDPRSKVMKTQDNKSILIELDEEGWKFSCDNFDINIDNGLYFGNKNSYKENQNIFISGMNNEKEQIIKWEISRL